MSGNKAKLVGMLVQGAPSRRIGWFVLGLGVVLAGLSCMLWVTYGAPADWTGPVAIVRWLKPFLSLTVVGAVFCFYRASRGQ